MTNTALNTRTLNSIGGNTQRKINTLTFDLTFTCFNCPSRCFRTNSDSEKVTLYCERMSKRIGNFPEMEIMLRRRPHECPRNIKEEKKAI